MNRLIAVALLVLTLGGGLVVATPEPAASLWTPSDWLCNNPDNPEGKNSVLCDSPAEFGVIANEVDEEGVLAGAALLGLTALTKGRAGAAASGATATGVRASWASLSGQQQSAFLMAGGAAVATTTGIAAGQMLVDESTTDLTFSPGASPGWVNGLATLPGYAFDVPSSPDWGQAGTLTIRAVGPNCVGNLTQPQWQACADAEMGTYYSARIRVFLTDGTSVDDWFDREDFCPFNGSTYSCTTEPMDFTYMFPEGVGVDRVAITPFGTTYGNLWWYPLGHQDRPADSPGGMVGTLETTIECKSVDGTESITFTETYTGGFEMDVAAKECPAGSVMVGAVADWITDEGTERVYDYTAPEEITRIPTEFPRCLTVGECGLSLWRIFADAPAQHCGTAAVGCPDWWSTVQTTPNVYECRVGSVPVDLGECAMFRNPGQISPVIGVEILPDGTVDVKPQTKTINPEDYDEIKPAPVPPVNPDPQPNPNPPVPPPTPGCIGAECVTPPERTDTAECFPQGWGIFNPWEWVAKPVRCVLVWAFVPRPPVIQAELHGVQSVVDDHGVLRVMSDAADVPSSLSDGWDQGCTRMGVDLSQIGADDGLYIECSPATNLGSGASSILTLRNLGAVAIGLFTAWAAFLLVRAHFGGKRAGGDDE